MKNLVVAILLLCSCENFPKDPSGTLNRITNGNLRVGYSENPPWVIKTSNAPIGIEAMLMQGFAHQYRSRIVWVNNSEANLFKKLENKELDIVIAGITNKTPWKNKKIDLTRPFRKENGQKHVIAVIQGENRFLVALETYIDSQHNPSSKSRR